MIPTPLSKAKSQSDRTYDILILAFCLAAGVFWMFAIENVGDLYIDEVYQTICVRRYKEAPLGLLSYWIGYLWTSAFGFTILNLRILTSIELLLSVAITSCCCFNISRNLRLSAFMFLLGCVMLRAGTFYIYNWDTGSYLFDAIALCLLISYVRKEKPVKLFFLGLVIGLMTLGRTTSVIMLPLSMIFIAIFRKRKAFLSILIDEILIIIGWLLAMAVMTSIILGSPFAYISEFQAGNVITGHTNIHTLWGHLAWVTLDLPFLWTFGVGTMLLSILFYRLLYNYRSFIILGLWLIYIIWFQSYLSIIFPKIEINHGIGTPIGIGLLLSWPIFQLFHKKQKMSREIKFGLWACVVLLISITFGSDAYIRRMTVGFSLPLIVAFLWELRNKSYLRWLKTALGLSMITFSTLLICNLIVQISEKSKLEKADIPPLKGLFIKAPTYTEITHTYEAVSLLKKNNVPYLYIGDHMTHELIHGSSLGLYFHNYHSSITQKEVWDAEKDPLLDQVEAVVYPDDNYYRDIPVIAEELRQKGFTDSLKVGEAMIFFRNVPKQEIINLRRRFED